MSQKLNNAAEELAVATQTAPFFPAGLRGNLTAASEFATECALIIEQLEENAQSIDKALINGTENEAHFLDRLAELDARIAALEAKAV